MFNNIIEYIRPIFNSVTESIMGNLSLRSTINKLTQDIDNVKNDQKLTIEEKRKIEYEKVETLNQLEQSRKEIIKLQKEINRQEGEYNDLKNYIKNLKLNIKENNCDYVLIGPKGHGKTTFFVLKKLIKENNGISIENGTIEFQKHNEFQDSIGIDLTLEKITKLLAYFICEGFPNTIILCTQTRPLQARIIFAHFMITDFYICKINTENHYNNIEGIYDEKIYNEYKNNGFKTIKHDTLLNKLNSFNNLYKTLFPMDIQLPDYQEMRLNILDNNDDFEEKINTHNMLKYKLCKEIKKYNRYKETNKKDYQLSFFDEI